jgi:lipoprotein-anchoring transpeptidase ErfK/SrfK
VAEPGYTVYRQERPSTRRRWPYIVIAAVCVFAALAAWQVVGVPRVAAVTPGPGTYVKNPSMDVVLNVSNLSHLKGVRVTLDGKDITADTARDGGKLTFKTGELGDGEHTVSFSARSSNLLRRAVDKTWRFTVDTSIPTLKLEASTKEGKINTSPSLFSGTTEPYAFVTVSSGSVKASGEADASGAYAVSVKLPDGPSDVTITTADRAGNSTAKQMSVYVDAEAPVLKTTTIDAVSKRASFKFTINAQDQLGEPKVKVVLDGEKVEYSGPASHGRIDLKGLAQGKHTITVTASDKGGNVVTRKQTFVVDSTEHFGSKTMWIGAQGQDVKKLQKLLKNAGVYTGKRTGEFDEKTEKAVKKFQSQYGLTEDGIVGGAMLTALSGQIVVDLSEHRLYLYSDGKLIKTYPVATGQPAYPTYPGTFHIVDKVKDPTWLPPNSDWAKNATPIPPGTENPLGTRWMGTSQSGVGIHGVPPSEDGTIGSFASHGCIRMHNWDAVDLFDRVVVGMPIIIRP